MIEEEVVRRNLAGERDFLFSVFHAPDYADPLPRAKVADVYAHRHRELFLHFKHLLDSDRLADVRACA